MEDNYKAKSRFNIYLLIIIVMIILLLLTGYSFSYFGKIDNNPLVPTGNIDIFDVIIDCEKCDDCNCNCDVPAGKEIDKPIEPEEPIVEPEEPFVDDGKLTIYDRKTEYSKETALRIFENPAYEFDQVIAPGSTNTYVFVVRNANDFNIKYDIDFSETNEMNINMQYRLKSSGKYIVGDENTWVKASNLNLKEISLASKTLSSYSLEWKWIDDENDTEIGKNAPSYGLGIKIYAEII